MSTPRTPEEWNIHVKHSLWDAGLDGPKSAERGEIMNTVHRLIQEAVDAERSACADIADLNSYGSSNSVWGRGSKYTAEMIRDAIRARGEKP